MTSAAQGRDDYRRKRLIEYAEEIIEKDRSRVSDPTFNRDLGSWRARAITLAEGLLWLTEQLDEIEDAEVQALSGFECERRLQL